MDITELLTKHALDLTAKVLENKFIKSESKLARNNVTPKNLATHLSYVANWSARIQFLGLGTAKDTDTESINLIYHESARKFRGRNSDNKITTELALLNIAQHHILIGDPGAGKTTSLKRIARTLLQSDSSRHVEEACYPILIRLKEIDKFSNIYELLAEILGFTIGVNERVIIEEEKTQYIDDNGNVKFKITKVERKEPYAVIGQTELKLFLNKFLDESGALILIDGLDEAKDEILRDVLKSISKLALELSNSKLIVTSRSGLFYSLGTIEGFDILDILPLDSDQIKSLAKIWFKNPSSFFSALEKTPYKDLANRPLLLSQLLFIFDRYGMLPKNPREIYQLIVELLLKEWDADRNIIRASQYSGFSPKRKSEFLAELAFNLMYRNEAIQFSSPALTTIYKNICQKYELPEDEVGKVVGEIESHTGIVVSVGYMLYEFSHLSIQEFLCADYIVRSPLTPEITTLIRIRPEPVAIAIALASDSSSWLSNLIIDQYTYDKLKLSISPFLSRLIVERPVFRPNEILGYCVLYIYSEIHNNDNDNVMKVFDKFSNLVGIHESVEMLLNKPSDIIFKKNSVQGIEIRYTMPRHNISHSSYTKSLIVPRELLVTFFKKFGFKSKKLD